MKFFDSHCHLDFKVFDSDRTTVLRRCYAAGISAIMIPAVSQPLWTQLDSLLQDNRQISCSPVLYGALGLHPLFTNSHSMEDIRMLDDALQQHSLQIVALGEIGLDFWEGSPDFKLQERFFCEQLKLAKKHELPVILHARKSHDQILKQLRSSHHKHGGIVHAFSGSEQQARQYIDLGFKLGLGGGITYPRARKTRALATNLPLDALVLETDAPDMPLNGFQGQRNTPERLPVILETLSSLRQETKEEIAKTLFHNTEDVLRIKS